MPLHEHTSKLSADNSANHAPSPGQAGTLPAGNRTNHAPSPGQAGTLPADNKAAKPLATEQADGYSSVKDPSCASGTGKAPQPVRGVLFDLDGTLLDTLELISRSFHHAMIEVLGHDESMERFCTMLGQPLREQMACYAHDGVELEALLTSYRTHNALIEREAIRIFEGIPAMLDNLQTGGWHLGVVTSKLHGTAKSNLEVFGLIRYFACLVGADDCPEHKPHPAPVVRGCELLGLDPAACLYVGDSPFDMQAGSGAGCATVAVHWGQFDIERLRAEQPSFEARIPDDIVRIAGM